MISGKRYKTFAFTKAGYNMLIEEHKHMIKRDWQSEVVPYWIYYYEERLFRQGIKLNDFNEIQKSYEYNINDKERKEQELKTFYRLLEKSTIFPTSS